MDSRSHQATEPTNKFSPIRQFAIKTAIVSFACIVSIIVVASYIDDLIQSRIDHIHSLIESQYSRRIGGREFWVRLERILEDQADPKNDLSPEKRRKLLAHIRTISDKWRPFLTEALGGEAGKNDRQVSP